LLLLAVMTGITMLTWCFRSPQLYGLVISIDSNIDSAKFTSKSYNAKEWKVYSFMPNCSKEWTTYLCGEALFLGFFSFYAHSRYIRLW
jgi:hypothetical protein